MYGDENEDYALPQAEEKRLQWITRNQSDQVRDEVRFMYSHLEARTNTGIEASMCIAICLELRWRGIAPDDWFTCVRPQFPVEWLRLDFLVVPKPQNAIERSGVAWAEMLAEPVERVMPEKCFAIECDGEPFHSKERDERRDRWLLTQYGIPTYRFSDQEISFDPHWCVIRAFDRWSFQAYERTPG